MAVKIHLKANKGLNGIAVYARCAAQAIANGKSRRNSRNTYSSIPQSNIVDFATFRSVHSADSSAVCFHCCDMGLPVYNSQRAAKGLPPVKSLFEQ